MQKSSGKNDTDTKKKAVGRTYTPRGLIIRERSDYRIQPRITLRMPRAILA